MPSFSGGFLRLPFHKYVRRNRIILRILLFAVGLLVFSLLLLNFGLPLPSENILNVQIDQITLKPILYISDTRHFPVRKPVFLPVVSSRIDNSVSVLIRQTEDIQNHPADPDAHQFLGFSLKERTRLRASKSSGSQFRCSLSGVRAIILDFAQ